MRYSVFMFLLAAAAMLFTAPAHADEAAEVFVQQILDEAEPYLNTSSEAERLEGISELVEKYVDMRRVSRFVLGQYARRLTDEQKAEYEPLFKTYATQVYQKVLSEYSGQKLVVTDSIDRSERDIIVNSKIAKSASSGALGDVTVHWRIYRNGSGEMKIVDAGADQVLLALEQRGTFTNIIANNGGVPAGVDALIAELRQQTGGA
ncbi:MAG: ABC transporter substrate-binding protein [Pseudomonadota bacterium]